MLKTFHVQNYKALRDVTLELTPIHVLIGPNDSGKTSLLEALRAYSRITRMPGIGATSAEVFEGRWAGRQLVWRQTDSSVSFDAIGRWVGRTVRHVIAVRFQPTSRKAELAHNEVMPLDHGSPLDPANGPLSWLAETGGSVQFYRWIPSLLALPVAFDFTTQFGMELSGFGLAMYLNDILTGDHEKFGELERRFHDSFPSVRRIRLNREAGFQTAPPNFVAVIPAKGSGLGIYFEQANGDTLAAAQASDGMMLVLAYLAILYSPQPPALLLIEEPENGVHPRRLQEVLRILRELVSEQDRTQVVLTTHSPYVVDQFKPEEVTLCLKGPDGAVTTHRLSNSKSVREQMDIFQLGEIWTAEGDEALAAPADAQEAASP